MTPEFHDTAIKSIQRKAGSEGLERIMKENDIDILITNSSSALCGFTAYLSWPIATIPVGWEFEENGQPCGVFVAAKKGSEGLLLRFMEAVDRLLYDRFWTSGHQV